MKNCNQICISVINTDMLSVQVIHDIPNSTISTTFSQFVALFINSVFQRSIVSRFTQSLFTFLYSIKLSIKLFYIEYYYTMYVIDPSAGSPTETLLRLLLPLNSLVCKYI